MIVLYKLNDEVHVNPQEIITVERISDRWIQVRMRNGDNYSVDADYGKSLYQTQARIIMEINEACAKQ